MRIRFFQEDDYAPISQLVTRIQANPIRAAEVTPERLRQELAARGNLPQDNFLVLESPDGAVVGFCGYQTLPDGRALMEGPVVEAEWRGKGWAARLWQELSAVLQARAIRQVSMVLGQENQLGEDFALRQGFRHERTELIVVAETPGHRPCPPPPGIRIEVSGPELDLAAYGELHAQMFERRSPSYLALLARMPTYRILVAREGTELRGLLELEFMEGVATIESYGVAAEHRRRGLGRALLAAALDLAWSTDGTTLVRQIWNTNDPNYLNVYLDMGFTCKYSIRSLVREVGNRTPAPTG